VSPECYQRVTAGSTRCARAIVMGGTPVAADASYLNCRVVSILRCMSLRSIARAPNGFNPWYYLVLSGTKFTELSLSTRGSRPGFPAGRHDLERPKKPAELSWKNAPVPTRPSHVRPQRSARPVPLGFAEDFFCSVTAS
jgi:hypothetical protein